VPDPYISITDFTTRWQVMEMLRVLINAQGARQSHKLGVGVMMSHKTLNGLPTKWTDVFPRNEDVAGIFTDHPMALNTLHYADYEGINVAENLARATEFGGPNMHALQLDMIWPDSRTLIDHRIRYPRIKIILQINSRSLDMVDNDPRQLLRALRAYNTTVDYVLLDKSMGRGQGMRAETLIPFVEALAVHRSDLGIVVAGGLGPETIHLAAPIVIRFQKQISFCAQGQMRASGNALDPIEWDRAAEYLRQSVALLRR
jgi:hypothetical protein